MRFAVASTFVAAASAVPLLNLNLDISATLRKITGHAVQTVNEAPETVHLVWTNVKSTTTQSLSVLDGAGELVLAHTCGNRLVDGVFSSLPIDFSKVDENGLGTFIYGLAELPVVSEAVAGVNCIQQSGVDVAVVDCTVPLVRGLVLETVSNVNDIATCLTSDLPLIGSLPGLVNALNIL
ncbi:hypothetical protein B0I35DRAFT_172766 [Stachybotrys elegans]|uniref:Uncharacterized protein n=1 Tax=Stachybotrys elegans TaxID=80388 RepID=A0A8K0WU67_9HYPO|nr:hypothetical protein B0I35DRAFT_172766 [Stachybotrys elegans]